MYTPNNPQVYTAAYSGALAGLALASRSLTDVAPADYVSQANIAGAYAQALDTEWGSVAVAESLEIQGIQSGSQAAWQSRGSQSTIGPLSGIAAVAAAVVAAVQAGEVYYAANGIPNPPFAGGNGSLFLNRVVCAINNGSVENPYSASPILHTQPGGNVAGGYNGGGVGNKVLLGFRVGNLLPLGSLNTLAWTWKNLNPDQPVGLVVYANLVLDINGDGSAYKILSIDPASLPALNVGTTVTNVDGSKTTTWNKTQNVLVVLGLLEPPPTPAPPNQFVPPTLPLGGIPPYGLPAGWNGVSYSIASILAAYPSARLAVASSLDGGMPKAPNVTPAFMLGSGDSNNNIIQAFQVTNVLFNGVQV